MTLLGRIQKIALGKSVEINSVSVTLLPNGLTHVFDYGSKMWATFNMEGKQVGGSLPVTPEQYRALTGSQV